MTNIEINIYKGIDILPFIEKTSEMRIRLFKEFPYLYQGSMDYEREYMKAYAKDPKSTIAIASCDKNIIGVSTGIPLVSESSIVDGSAQLITQAGEAPEDYYYYGEILIEPEHRGNKISSKLYSAQNELVKKWGYKKVCILTVVRQKNHPLKPKEYQSLDSMWTHFNYNRFIPPILVTYDWNTFQCSGEVRMQSNELEMWHKTLR